MAAGPQGRLLTMGKIGAPYGVRGWLKVHSYTVPPENILRYSPWWIRRHNEWVTIEPKEGRRHGKALVVHFEGLEDREGTRGLVGAEIAIERGELEPPGEGHYYWVDLIGAAVINREGIRLGRVERLIETGGQDVMVLSGDRERLIPFVLGRYVLNVNLEQGKIIVDWNESD